MAIDIPTLILGSKMIVIIGGSGFYDFLEAPEFEVMETPFGSAILQKGSINGKSVVFIPRHGVSHSILPSQINYRANIFAAYTIGATKIIATNAVGTSDEKAKPGDFVILDQIIDMTHGRETTFFDGSKLEVKLNSGEILSGVVHTDVTHPFDFEVRELLISACRAVDEQPITSGTLVVFNGPRYETPAEIKAFTLLGGQYFGMTSAPEAFLAKELKIPYATLAIATNYAAGMQVEITHEEVGEMFAKRIDVVKKVIQNAISL